MIVISTEGRIGAIECDVITFDHGWAILCRKTEDDRLYTIKELHTSLIAKIINKED